MAATVILLYVTFVDFMLHFFHVGRDFNWGYQVFGVFFEDSDVVAENMIGKKISLSESLGTLHDSLNLVRRSTRMTKKSQ